MSIASIKINPLRILRDDPPETPAEIAAYLELAISLIDRSDPKGARAIDEIAVVRADLALKDNADARHDIEYAIKFAKAGKFYGACNILKAVRAAMPGATVKAEEKYNQGEMPSYVTQAFKLWELANIWNVPGARAAGYAMLTFAEADSLKEVSMFADLAFEHAAPATKRCLNRMEKAMMRNELDTARCHLLDAMRAARAADLPIVEAILFGAHAFWDKADVYLLRPQLELSDLNPAAEPLIDAAMTGMGI